MSNQSSVNKKIIDLINTLNPNLTPQEILKSLIDFYDIESILSNQPKVVECTDYNIRELMAIENLKVDFKFYFGNSIETIEKALSNLDRDENKEVYRIVDFLKELKKIIEPQAKYYS